MRLKKYYPYYYKGFEANLMGDDEKTMAYFKTADELGAGADAMAILADYYYDRKNWPLAIAAYNKALEKYKYFDRVYSRLSMIYEQKNDIPKAYFCAYLAYGVDYSNRYYSKRYFDFRTQLILDGRFLSVREAYNLAPNEQSAYK